MAAAALEGGGFVADAAGCGGVVAATGGSTGFVSGAGVVVSIAGVFGVVGGCTMIQLTRGADFLSYRRCRLQ